jgi:hypothetical protein
MNNYFVRLSNHECDKIKAHNSNNDIQYYDVTLVNINNTDEEIKQIVFRTIQPVWFLAIQHEIFTGMWTQYDNYIQLNDYLIRGEWHTLPVVTYKYTGEQI